MMYKPYLCHKGGGNPNHDPKTGRFTFGRRRYITTWTDSEGREHEQLTKLGQKRYERDSRANAAKSKDKRAKDEDALVDPDRWVKEDISNAGSTISGLKTTLESAQRLSDQIYKSKPNKRMELKELSDAELNARINRERLERQYNEYFNTPQEKKGKKIVDAILGYGIPAVTLAGGVVMLIGGIQSIKNGGKSGG